MTPLRFAVIGEGRDEHGACSRGPNGMPLDNADSRGALVRLVARYLSERLGLRAEPVRWLPPARPRGPRPGAIEVLRDQSLLAPLLDALLRPVTTTPGPASVTDLVVLAVDQDQRGPFERSVKRVREHYEDRRVIPVVFEPELEVLFLQSKAPLEQALGLPHCTTSPPNPKARDSKAELSRWLGDHGKGVKLDAHFREEIVQNLDLGLETPLAELSCWRCLAGDLDRWRP